MRIKQNINNNWLFTKDNVTLEEITNATFEMVNVPHTWNNLDGQDGGGDYYRATCWYKKEIEIKEEDLNKELYLEFEAVNSIADVYVNGKESAHHEGGFSTFRIHLNSFVHIGINEIIVKADNSANNFVYPQFADFTFFGGIYRNVNLIKVGHAHFDLEYSGGPGIMVTPILNGTSANIEVKGFVINHENASVVYKIINDGAVILEQTVPASNASANFVIDNPHLWDGVVDPHLYELEAYVLAGDTVVDNITVNFGIRSFKVDPEKGFFLNGRSYPLHGVSRHQDRLDKGWAISEEDHIEDMELIKEVGANTIRLAHYQHAQFFYDLCDKEGMVIWAEIPYISSHMDTGRDNVFSQMKELIIQNYNHPSIVCWGLSNEITMRGETERLVQDHKDLNDYVHATDPTRLTTIAEVSMVPMDSEMTRISDIISYNHYFGWYVGNVEDNGPWLDEFHEKHPDISIGLSEYGCEAILDWHTEEPKRGDYTEEYQAYYHEEMLKTFAERPYLWSTHVWNMFDFAADSRDEGGKQGRNHKGLVTYDRKTKKDSFYIYKAYWNKDDKFVHICSKRYEERAKEDIVIKVYSNLDDVTLFHNGQKVNLSKQDTHIFYFNVKLIEGNNTFEAVSGECTDTAVFTKIAEENPKYHFSDGAASVTNWFDKDGNSVEFKFREGYLNINSLISDIVKNPVGKEMMLIIMGFAMKKMGMGNGKIDENMLKMASTFSIMSLIGMVGRDKVTTEMLVGINNILNTLPVEYEIPEREQNLQTIVINGKELTLDMPEGYLNLNCKVKDLINNEFIAGIVDCAGTLAPQFNIKKMGFFKLLILKQMRIPTLLNKIGKEIPLDLLEQVNGLLNKIKK